MIKQFIALTIILGLSYLAEAGTVTQTKGTSAIIELSDDEIQNLSPYTGQNIQISFNGQQVDATVRKISKRKILVSTSKVLSKQKNVEVLAGGPGVSISKKSSYSDKSKASVSSKNWTLGANVKYVLMGKEKRTISSVAIDIVYSGFDLSGIGFYYWGSFGVGVEGEYAMLQGKDTTASHTISQMQMSILGEYKISTISFGALFTIASNYKSSDGVGNELSVNGMGYGIFATYSVTPQVRLIFDYRMANYKLDPATIEISDMRIGAGYYF
ncbi:MAG: hypothetical protein A2622_08235 [Bdellovibrionales bacterium RIFCSPHIGHO2_01_FULL_40_29]|nr:MAG: hypothetical protein A2622_08235 [Bdellovibrionales bacterium RIFCSPHIGHO2_01_FULL_40_29]OFZ35484.1 MAG: hypothetical protein A3D17_07470 [Bdellovibrionales bacterium RIFCSPHIGHO2_02_FULL_40_15]